MPYLSFNVEADYSELIRLQQEIARTKTQLQNFRPGQAGASIDELNKRLAESTFRYRQLAQAAIKSGAAMEMGIKQNLSGIFTEVNRIQDLLTRPMMAVGGLAGVYGLGEFLSKITSIRGQFQQMNASIETMIGKRKGEKLNAELQEFAKISPLEFAPTVSTAQMMLGFGIDSDKVPRYLQAIGDIAMGDTRRFQSLSLAFSQMSAAGKLMGQDLMQMVNAGFQPLQIISEKTGKSIGTLKEEMSQGKISAEMVQQAFIDASSEGGKYYNMSETASKTIPGAIAKLNDSMDLMFNDIGTNMEGTLVGIIDAASTIVENIGRIIPVLATAAAAFGVYKTSVMLSNFAAKQSVIDASKDIIDGFDAELKKIQEMQNAKLMEGYDDDIRKALEKGSIDQTYADSIMQGRLWQQEQERIAENERKIAEEAQKTYETHLKDMQTQREQSGRGLDSDINDANFNGTITNDTAERLQNERDYAQAIVDTKEAALESAKLQQTASQQLVDAAKERVDSAKELMEMAEQAGDADDKKAAAEEYLAALEEQATRLTELQTAEEGVNTAERELNSAVTAQQAVQTQTATAAIIGETTATNTNTTSTNVNTAATSRGSIVTALATAKDKALTIGKYALTAATNACTKAWNGLKVAFMTNPIGMIITALTTVIGLFMTFKDENEESSAEVERFGEAAAKTKRNVETLYAVLDSVNKDSKVYRDAMKELTDVAKDYGIQINAEKDTIEQLNDKRAQLIKLIEAEGEARQLANRIESYQQDKQKAADDFIEEMKDSIEDESDGQAKENAERFARIIADTVERKKAELAPLVSELEQAQKDHANESAKGEYQDYAKTNELRKRIAELQTTIAQTANEEAKNYAKAMGMSEEYILDIKDTSKLVGQLTNQITNADKFIEQTKNNAKAVNDELERTKDAAPPVDYSTFDSNKLTEELTKVSQAVDDLNAKPVKPETDAVNLHSLIETAQQAQDKIGDVDNSSATPSTDNAALDETAQKAAQAEDKMNDVDNAVATPYIDTKYLDIALNTLDKIKITLREVGGQVLNTTGAERQQLQGLLAKYGKDGKIAPGTKMSKEDAALYNSIVANARKRSNFTFGGQKYQLNSEQSAILQQFIDRYGTNLNEANMSDVDKRLYRSLKSDLQVGAYNSNKGNQQQAMTAIKTALEQQISDAKSTEDFAAIRKAIDTQMAKVDQSSDLYEYYEQKKKELDKKDKSKSKKGGSKDDPKQRAYEIEKARLEEQRRTDELLLAEQNRQIDLELEMRKDSSEKEIAVIHQTAKKKREALLEERRKEAERLEKFELQQWLKAGKNRKEYQFYAQYTPEQLAQMREQWTNQAGENIGYNTQLSQIDFTEEQGVRKVQKEIAETMLNYLKEFGSFQQKRFAIEQEYAEKIANAKNDAEKKLFEAQQSRELGKLDIEALKQQIDWGSLFGDFGTMLSDQVQPTIDKLEAITKTDDFRNSTFEEQKAIFEIISTLKGSIVQWDNNILGTLGDAVVSYQDALRANSAAVDEESRLRDVANEKAEALRKIQEANEEARRKGEAVNMEAENAASADLAKAEEDLANASRTTAQTTTDVANAQQNLSTATNTAREMFSQLASGLQSLASGSLQGVWSGMNQLSKLFTGNDNLANKMGGALIKGVTKLFGEDSKVGKAAAQALSSLGGPLMGEIVGMFFSILDILKDGIGNFIASLIDTVLGAVNGLLNSILSGEIVTSVGKSVLSGVGNILDTISFGGFSSLMNKWGLSGDSDKNYERDMERLSMSNDALRKSIDDLADEMRDASIADMVDLYATQKDALTQSMNNTQEMMKRSGAAYSNGFLGIGGHKSSNHKINKGMSSNDWDRISKAVGFSVRDAGSFFNLTSEQMAKVAKDAPDLYAKLKSLADDGYQNAAQYMDEYIQYYKELEELENAYRENLTDVSFDSIKDEFKSALLDMESSTEDFTKNFEKMMQQAVVNALINSKYKDRIQKWYENFAEDMESDNELTAEEQKRRKKEYDDIVADAINDRNNLAKTMGWDTSVSQQSSSRSLASMSQDTGDAIEGRLTAMQIAVESIRANGTAQGLSLADLNNDLLKIISESSKYSVFCSNAERQMAKIFIELQTISENTGAIVKPIKTMQEDIAEIKKNTKNL